MPKTHSFTGTIRAVTPDGRCGVVALEQPVDGKEYAVIAPETEGRIGLMNGQGALPQGDRVCGTAAHATQGHEALRALSVSKAD